MSCLDIFDVEGALMSDVLFCPGVGCRVRENCMLHMDPELRDGHACETPALTNGMCGHYVPMELYLGERVVEESLEETTRP